MSIFDMDHPYYLPVALFGCFCLYTGIGVVLPLIGLIILSMIIIRTIPPSR